jgi:hypothetical protein
MKMLNISLLLKFPLNYTFRAYFNLPLYFRNCSSSFKVLLHLIGNRGRRSSVVWLNLELKKLLASSLRQKILKGLSECKEINMMGLVRKINSAYNEVNRNLIILEREDIVTNIYRGRMRFIKLNRENPKTVLLLQVLRQLESKSVAGSLITLFCFYGLQSCESLLCF